MATITKYIQDLYDKAILDHKDDTSRQLSLVLQELARRPWPDRSAEYYQEQWQVAKEALKATQSKNEYLQELLIREQDKNKLLIEAKDHPIPPCYFRRNE